MQMSGNHRPFRSLLEGYHVDSVMKDLRISLVSCTAAVGHIDENIEKLVYWTHCARDAGAQVVCFPELSLIGYSLDAESVRIPTEIDGHIRNTLQHLADQSEMTVLAGWLEGCAREKRSISHLVAVPRGKMGHYRKTHLAPPERTLYCAGNDVPVFRLASATIGIQLCYDAHFPELSSIMTANGMDILFVPHASPHGSGQEKLESWRRHLVARAYDNAVFVLACNLSGSNDTGLHFPGVALAIDPSGHVIGSMMTETGAMLTVDLKASVLENIRSHPMRHFFPNRRPELYENHSAHTVIDLRETEHPVSSP